MVTLSEIALALFLIGDFVLAGVSRLRSAIRFVAMQGFVVGILPILIWDWAQEGCPGMRIWSVVFINVLVKGVFLPVLLVYAVNKARTRRELEPIVSFPLSQLLVFAIAVGAFVVGRLLQMHTSSVSELAVSVALTTMGTGLLLICGRKKAITQVLGFLVLENGISVFGAAILFEYGIVVELGILLDIFALVFILGIAVFQISRTFASTDTNQLNHLGDTHLMHSHHQHDRTHA
jgi:hydrogenase-4 component E